MSVFSNNATASASPDAAYIESDPARIETVARKKYTYAMNATTFDNLETDVARVVRFRILRDGAVMNRLPLWSGYHQEPRRRVIADDVAAFLREDDLRAKYFDGLSPVHSAVLKFSKLTGCAVTARKNLEAELCRYFPPQRRWWEFWKP